MTGVEWERRMKEKEFDIAVSSASKSEVQTERNAEIKFDKDSANKIFFFFHGSYNSLLQGLSQLFFGTSFDHEPGFKTEILIKYRIHSRKRPDIFGYAGF